MASDDDATSGVSPMLDRLSCDLLGFALDTLAAGGEVLAVASACDEDGRRLTCSFEDDAPEACLEGARAWVRKVASGADEMDAATCYAIAYEGAVADDGGVYRDALLLEFGDRGRPHAFSAYVLVDGIGRGEGFSWSEPQPAGEVDPLL